MKKQTLLNNLLLLLLIILLTNNVFGQNRPSYEKIDKLDRNSTIKLAKEQLDKYLEIIKDSSFDYSLIDTIRIYKNKKIFQVQFEQKVKYAPLNTNYYYGFTIDIVNNVINRILVLNNGCTNCPIEFYHPNPQDLVKLKYILELVSAENKCKLITIKEQDTFYDLGYIKLDKVNGNKTYDNYEEFLNENPDDILHETKIK